MICCTFLAVSILLLAVFQLGHCGSYAKHHACSDKAYSKKVLATNPNFTDLTAADLIVMNSPSPGFRHMYEGTPNVDWLRKRTHEIIIANPWLSGRLINMNGSIVLTWPRLGGGDLGDDEALPCCFNHIEVNNLDTFLAHSTRNVWSVKSGIAVLNKDEPLWKVTVATQHGSQKFVFCISLSHVAGDVHTMSRITRMFNERVTHLTAQRVHIENLPLEMQSWQNEENETLNAIYARSLTVGKLSKFSAIVHKIMSVFFPKGECFPSGLGNSEVTSQILSQQAPSCGFMPVNLRSIVEGYHEDLAGNYLGTVVLWPQDYSSADGVKNALLKYYKFEPTELKNEKSTQFSIIIVSNMTSYSFARDPLHLHGCTFVKEILPNIGTIGDAAKEGAYRLGLAIILQDKWLLL